MDIGLSMIGNDDPKAHTRFINLIVGALKGALRRVFGFTIVTGYGNPTANAVVSVSHDLGSVPLTFVVSPLDNYSVWATEADRLRWTTKEVYVRTSISNAKFQIILFSKGA